MKTTVQSLKKLGKKLNGADPTGSTISTVIDGIADGYSGGQADVGVTSIGGVDGAITLGTGLSMSGQQLQVSASGGTQLYKHTFSGTVNVENESMSFTFNIISTASSAMTNATTANSVLNNFISGSTTIEAERVTVVGVQPVADMESSLEFYFALCVPAGDGIMAGLKLEKLFADLTDTVTAL